MKPDLSKRYLGWTIVERSCELSAMARELGDNDLADQFTAAAERAGVAIGVSRSLIARIARDFSRARQGKPCEAQ